MERHLRRCPTCATQKAAEESLTHLLRAELAADSPQEAEAVARVTCAWQEALPAPDAFAGVRAPRWRVNAPRWVPASAALALGAALFVFTVTAPTRALAKIAGAMDKADRFHLRMQVPSFNAAYEAWGERSVGARVEERQGGKLTMIVLDDGQTLRRFYPEEKQMRQSGSKLGSIYKHAAGLSASRLLRLAAKGDLLRGQDWLGHPTAREVAPIARNGREERRIQVDLQGGFFERMVVYADPATDRVVEANLYTDSRDPDTDPFASLLFDYPERVDPSIFQLHPPKDTKVRFREADLDPDLRLP
jgi:hypothetical protein